jgi:methylated-DNA-[protein]-cysteine S-methyltransferase
VTGIEYLPADAPTQAPQDALARRAVRELDRYLADPGFRFTLPLAPAGTPFRQRVWEAIARIPAGESRTYGELARELHTAPPAVRMPSTANGVRIFAA